MEGYYQTPNVNIPYNDRPKGEVAQIALDQLKEWEQLAESWPVYTDGRSNRCSECHQNIWFTKDPLGHEYTYDPSEILALKVAHVRQSHSDSSNRDSLSSVDSAADNGKEYRNPLGGN
jgi:hypothetical protein